MCVHKMCLLCLSETTLQRVNDLRYCKQHLVVTMQKPEVITKKIEHEKDVEKRKNNVIIYKVAEVNADNATDRNESDSAFLLSSWIRFLRSNRSTVVLSGLLNWDVGTVQRKRQDHCLLSLRITSQKSKSCQT